MELEEAIERAIRHIATEKEEFPIDEINDYLIANGIINERMDPRAIFCIAEPILPVLGFECRGTYAGIIVSITKKVRNFNSEFIKRRMKEYDYLFKKSPYPLDNDQKTAVIVDDKHNLVIAGAGSGKNEYKKTMKAKQKKFQEQDKYVLVETTQGDFEEKNFLLLLEKRILKAFEEKYPGKLFTFTPLSYDELVKLVWEECQGSLKAVPLNISRFINIAKTYSLTPDDIKRRLSRGRWSPKQEAFAKIAINLYKLYEEELRSANQIDFGDMINLAVKELNENENLYRNVFDHILIDEYQDISTQRYKLIKVLMANNPDCKLFCVGDDWQSIMGFTGSNLDFFVDFVKYFDHPARTDLTTNYRSFVFV